MTHLVLKRRVRDSVTIGPDIVVTVVEVCGASVRLSIQAPRELDVGRVDAPRKTKVAP